jgi:hypothetical protein
MTAQSLVYDHTATAVLRLAAYLERQSGSAQEFDAFVYEFERTATVMRTAGKAVRPIETRLPPLPIRCACCFAPRR